MVLNAKSRLLGAAMSASAFGLYFSFMPDSVRRQLAPFRIAWRLENDSVNSRSNSRPWMIVVDRR